MEQITETNYQSVDIKALALNQNKFGTLTFEQGYKQLNKIQKWFIEFTELDYKNELPKNTVRQIEDNLQIFIEHLNWLRNFDISSTANTKQEHDDFESRVETFYDSIFQNFVLAHLNYLKQETALNSRGKKNLKKEEKELIATRKQYQRYLDQLKKQVGTLQREKTKIEEQYGEIAATTFGKHFEAQAKHYSKEAETWLENRNTSFTILLCIVILNLIVYFYLFTSDKLRWWPFLKPNEFFTIEYGLVKLALLSLMSYAISFSSKNYNVNANLKAINTHRKNIAETMINFLGSSPEKEEKTKILEKGVENMFKHLPIGYLPKTETKDEGPISSIFNSIFRQ